MGSKLNREAYEQLIREDLEWLEKMPDTLERHHIEQVLWDSVRYYYPEKE